MNEVVMEWENVVNRVAKCELGEKMIVCGRAARWWDEQIKDQINARREVYKKVVNGREDLWGEYCRLRKEVKQLVIEKKLNIWNEQVEKVKVNTGFDENKKEFWAFVVRKSKGKKKKKVSLKSNTGLSLTSTRGKLEVQQRHYQFLSKMSVDSVFDADWKEEVEENVNGYSSLSKEDAYFVLDKEIEKGEIVPGQWREGLIVNIFKQGDREDPDNYTGITLFSVVGKVFCKILNNRLVQCLDK